MNALAPPLKSNPVWILVRGIVSREIACVIVLSYRFIISIVSVWIVNFFVWFSSRYSRDVA